MTDGIMMVSVIGDSSLTVGDIRIANEQCRLTTTKWWLVNRLPYEKNKTKESVL
jgi:hypothetical protein